MDAKGHNAGTMLKITCKGSFISVFWCKSSETIASLNLGDRKEKRAESHISGKQQNNSRIKLRPLRELCNAIPSEKKNRSSLNFKQRVADNWGMLITEETAFFN